MLDTFASVGAARFDLTLTNLHGEKVRFRRGILLPTLRNMLPAQFESAAREKHNIIVRPHAPAVTFVQLDDLDQHGFAHVMPIAFLGLETSPGNFQGWIALPSKPDEDFVRRLRKGAGADPSASGATRIAGSLNFKEKYAPDFPRVAVIHAAPGRIVNRDEITALGLLAPLAIPPASSRVSRNRSR